MGRKRQTLKEMEAEYKEIEEKHNEVMKEIEGKKVSPFHFEFNNEGLNQLRDKINELIEFVNK